MIRTRYRALVTGGGGFLGTHLLAALQEAGHEIHTTLRPGGSRLPPPLQRSVRTHEVDLGRFEAVRTVVGEIRPDVIYHAAFPSAYADLSLRDQVAGGPLVLANLLDAAKRPGLSRFVHLGSFLEYGPSEQAHREDDLPKPATLRGAVKAAETQLVLGRTRSGDVPGVVLRVFSAYGSWEPAHRLVPKAITAALLGCELPLTAPGIGRDFVHAADVAAACLKAAVSDSAVGETFNVGGGRHVTNEEMVAEIERVSNRSIQVLRGAYGAHPTDGQVCRADISKTERILGWTPTDLPVGLQETIAWMDRSGSRD
ncbi:MAG: NAD(P)-dependent oxidoreductase [Thermoanaerobaculia bacterium]|nr:NAD(P)-dependent oxidoreductase [Thermoanaerobaculia bacterium]